jgi:hypothetical protein
MEGYAQIAERMATLPSLAIFRSFQRLRAQDLLYWQAELTELETKMAEEAAKTCRSNDDSEKLYSRDWRTLSMPTGNGDLAAQWKIALEIREKLGRYGQYKYEKAPTYVDFGKDETLLRYNRISKELTKPRRCDVSILAANLDDPKLSDYLLGLDSSVYKNENLANDLRSATPIQDFDVLTKSLIKLFLRPYNNAIGHRKAARANNSVNVDADLYHYDDEHLMLPVTALSTVLASLLPVAVIAVLYVVHPMPARLGLIAAFTAIFSIGVAVLTEARRADVFAATAA